LRAGFTAPAIHQERTFERFANLNHEAVEKAEKDEESLQFPLQSQADRL
jgi:hypothetical protein